MPAEGFMLAELLQVGSLASSQRSSFQRLSYASCARESAKGREQEATSVRHSLLLGWAMGDGTSLVFLSFLFFSFFFFLASFYLFAIRSGSARNQRTPKG